MPFASASCAASARSRCSTSPCTSGFSCAATVRSRSASSVRREICHAIVNALDSKGDFVLAANEDCDERFKHELMELVGELAEERAGSHINIRVRFSTGKSGTMPSVVPTDLPDPARGRRKRVIPTCRRGRPAATGQIQGIDRDVSAQRARERREQARRCPRGAPRRRRGPRSSATARAGGARR